MRWVIFGSGAVGGVVGARVFAAGHDVLLVARGGHLEAISRNGLRLRTPSTEHRYPIGAVGTAAKVAWQPGDVVVLAVKSMDTAAALTALAAHVHPATAVLCLQNGVANEPAALRLFANVYGGYVNLPASHLEPGAVVQHSEPVPGILDVGRYPEGLDPTIEILAAGLRSAGFDVHARTDVMRWKYAKLLLNLGNAMEALCGQADGLDEAIRVVRDEGETVLRAAGIDYASVDEETARCGSLLQEQPVDGKPRAGGSMWQSLARRTSKVEADYLNGEIVRLGRMHGVPTPANETARQLVNRHAREGLRPGTLTPEQFLAAIHQ